MSSTETSPPPTTLTREQLYDLVWQQPMSRLAKTLGISDQGLAKICDRFDVPRPKQGHWNKLAVGKPVETKSLPPARAGLPDTIRISPVPQGRPVDPATEKELEIAQGKTKKLRVAERLVHPHPVIAGWIARRERELKKREQVYDHRLRRLAAPTAFSPQQRRCHRILDALFKALETEKIAVSESQRRELFASAGREKIELQLRVKLRQVQRPLTADEQRWRFSGDRDYKLEYQETDVLIFEVKSWLPGGLQRTWQDGRKGTIEDMVGDILATLLAAFPLMVAERERREEQERLRQIEERRRHDLEQQRKLERYRFRRLLEHAGLWREAELARTFVAALRVAIPDPSAVIDGKPASEWLEWAEQRASLHDPLESNPLDVFWSIAEVTTWTYRDS